MGEHLNLIVFQEILIVLGAVSIVIPLFHRLKVSPVLGFLLIGMVLGPTAIGAVIREIPGLDWVVLSDAERIGTIAEFGVVFLMFMIGLELSFERLMLMRRLVFGLAPLQTILCAIAIAGVALLLNQSIDDAIVIGLALALSSTAVIIQVLSEENRLTTTVGRTSFAILLFQDIAVVPILFAVAIMGGANEGEGLGAFALALGQAALAVIVIIAAGRLLLRPLFRSVARTNSPELFMAACLLVLLGAAAATAAAGLSMAMGALLAGLLLAETEYRRQIEVLIEPFKGLLLGVFLISMGMTLNLNAIAAAPLLIAGAFHRPHPAQSRADLRARALLQSLAAQLDADRPVARPRRRVQFRCARRRDHTWPDRGAARRGRPHRRGGDHGRDTAALLARQAARAPHGAPHADRSGLAGACRSRRRAARHHRRLRPCRTGRRGHAESAWRRLHRGRRRHRHRGRRAQKRGAGLFR
ncbi:MAG: cation:proton antiporter [Terricaulis sp.]